MRRIRMAMFGTLCAGMAAAQVPAGADSVARCDSVVASARVDSVLAGIFVTVGRVDGLHFLPGQAEMIATAVGSAFVPPSPLRLSVFTGAAQMRTPSPVGSRHGGRACAPRC